MITPSETAPPAALYERLRQQIEDYLDESKSRAEVAHALLKTIDAAFLESEIDCLLPGRLGFDSVAAGLATKADASLDTLPDIVFILDECGTIVDCRGGDEQDLLFPRERLIGKRVTNCPFEDTGPKFEFAISVARDAQSVIPVDYGLLLNGTLAQFEARVVRRTAGGFLAVVRNTTRDGRADGLSIAGTQRPVSPSMLRATLEATADGIVVVDNGGTIVTSNKIFREMWQIPEELLQPGQESAIADFVLAQLKKPDIVRAKSIAIQSGTQARTTDIVQFHDGRFFECVSMPQRIDGEGLGRVWSFRNVTDRMQVERRIRHNAYHDSLTGLANRALFQDRLAQEVGRARRAGSITALFLLDLDRFKTVNDTLGHAAGDKLLVEVARRLHSRKRDGDTIARLGGDEFVLIVSNLRHREDAASVAEQLLEVLKPPIQVAEHELHISASIGIAIFPDDGEEVTALMKSADMALYRAKELGRDNFQIFEPRLNQRAMERLVMESDLRRAIHDQEFLLHFQPQFELKTGKMRGVEALVRWAQGGELISPAKFIPIAEECGLIVPLGSWVLKESILRCAEFNRYSREPLRMCVNVSALQIQRPNFANEVALLLQEAGLSPDRLVIELTESALMRNPGQGSYGMEQLNQMGVGIAMDDFGTGHSSLNYLSVLPVSLIKIDRSFVENCVKRKTDAAVLAAIVTMGHALGLKVLAEGVETEDQVGVLRSQGCDEVQGYLYGRPVPSERLIELLGHR